MKRRDGLPNRTSAADRARSTIVGAVLREIRTDARLSCLDVERHTDGVVKVGILSSYERGDRMVSTPRLLELARIYQVDLGVLMSVIERRIQNPRLTGFAVVSADE